MRSAADGDRPQIAWDARARQSLCDAEWSRTSGDRALDGGDAGVVERGPGRKGRAGGVTETAGCRSPVLEHASDWLAPNPAPDGAPQKPILASRLGRPAEVSTGAARAPIQGVRRATSCGHNCETPKYIYGPTVGYVAVSITAPNLDAPSSRGQTKRALPMLSSAACGK